MKQSEIKDLATNDLKERLVTERANLTKLVMNHAVSPLENPMQIKGTRRLIARMETELRFRELTENSK